MIILYGLVLFSRDCFLWRLNKISTQFGQHKLSILRERGQVYECEI